MSIARSLQREIEAAELAEVRQGTKTQGEAITEIEETICSHPLALDAHSKLKEETDASLYCLQEAFTAASENMDLPTIECSKSPRHDNMPWEGGLQLRLQVCLKRTARLRLCCTHGVTALWVN